MRHLLLLAVLAGCSRPAETSKIQLRIAAPGDLAPLGPQPLQSYSAIAQEWVYEPLVRLDAEGSTKLALASRLERIDSKSIRASIRADARFSDGSPVAPGDVVESLKSFNLSAYEKDGAVVIESEAVLPETVLSRALISKPGSGTSLGTGPFFVAEQDASHMLLRRKVHLPDHIDDVVIRSFPTPREAFARTLAGEADAYPLIDSRQIEFFEGVPRFRVLRAPNTNAIAVVFSTRRLDRNTRLALLASLPGPDLARMAYPNGCSPMQWESASFHSLPPGRPLNIVAVLKAGSHVERMALAVQRLLGPRGGDIEDLSYADHQHRLTTGEFDLLISTPIVWPQTDMLLLWHTKSPLLTQWYSNPKVDGAIDSGDTARAMRELMDDPPVDYVCLPERLAVVDARIKNARIGPFGVFETLADWEIAR
ncbi:MAG: ABC transporter substrate-binding protein [Myxococcales bacterium]